MCVAGAAEGGHFFASLCSKGSLEEDQVSCLTKVFTHGIISRIHSTPLPDDGSYFPVHKSQNHRASGPLRSIQWYARVWGKGGRPAGFYRIISKRVSTACPRLGRAPPVEPAYVAHSAQRIGRGPAEFTAPQEEIFCGDVFEPRFSVLEDGREPHAAAAADVCCPAFKALVPSLCGRRVCRPRRLHHLGRRRPLRVPLGL